MLGTLSARVFRLPQGRLDAIRQVLLFGGAYWLYRGVRGVVDGDAAQAFANARALIEAERAVGTFFEPALQAWAAASGPVLDVANWVYLNSHFTVTTAFLVWLYLARNHAFYYVRNMFLVAMGLALVGYVAFPTAPPRLMPEWGFADTVAAWAGQPRADGAEALFNPFAAVPSMHVAFALMIAVPAVRLVASRAARAAWAAYPALVTFVVIATANHFWLDVLFGAMVAALSAYTAHTALASARPEDWAWPRPVLGVRA